MNYFSRALALCLLTGAIVTTVYSQSETPVCAPNAVAPADGCMESRHDRFEDKTTVMLRMRVVGPETGGERLLLTLIGEYVAARKPPLLVTFAVTSYAPEGFRYSGEGLLNILAGDRRFRVPMKNLGQEQLAVYSYAQSFGGFLNFTDVKELAQMSDAELRFCDTEFRFGTVQMSRLQAFVRRIEEKK